MHDMHYIAQHKLAFSCLCFDDYLDVSRAHPGAQDALDCVLFNYRFHLIYLLYEINFFYLALINVI